jgi:hypothetical protein
VRRFLPWALLGLLGAGVVAGAVVGALGAPVGTTTITTTTTTTTSSEAGAWVARVLAATADADTAHFEYSHVTTSTNPLLHEVISGFGVVDFASGDVQVTETVSAPSLNAGSSALKGEIVRSTGQVIGIGHTTYQAVAQEGTPEAVWMKLTEPRDAHAELGLQTALSASVPLAVLGDAQRVVARRSLGHAVVSGLATRRWEVQTVPACPSPLTGPSYQTQEPTILSVDSRGRLVQVTTVVHTTGKLTAAVLKSNPALARAARGAATTTDTLRFYDFGQPVHITTPTHVVTVPFRSTGTAEARCTSK